MEIEKRTYGLYDAARMWFLAVVQSLEQLQMESIVGDNAVFYYRENGKTQGIINVHVDDFITMGTENFYRKVVDKLKTMFNFSKIERGEDGFRFTGVDIKTTSDGIIMNQDVYASCIQELEIPEGKNSDLLNKEQFKQFRGLTGKLIWLSEQTRPDLSFPSLEMSCRNRTATIQDMKDANKIVKQAKSGTSQIKFGRIGNSEDLKVLAFSDAAHLNADNKCRGTAGRINYLSNGDETRVSPLAWKSKTIPQVCKSAKAAETRALDICADEAIFIARVLNEMLTGKKGQSKEKQMRVIIKCDSMGLKETLNSTHQIEEKMLRPVVQNIKDLLTRGFIESVTWVPTEVCQADLLTKKGSGCKERVMEIIQSGDNL